jgi:hypothetical protein
MSNSHAIASCEKWTGVRVPHCGAAEKELFARAFPATENGSTDVRPKLRLEKTFG